MTVKTVSQAQFAEVTAMLDVAAYLEYRARRSGLTLARKVELQRKAKALREQAMEVGR